ncbi:hypothetical protein G6F46_000156 [Rhizopus delemar]|uniref:Myb-like domain-containing protein n=3 Tax=Rhizopus TaxID=4842 RepID=I1CDX1_RHIO9|nr:hypothetical protein RO3G_11362 [Rhizopus delemar RA 99-880]KAG1467029.1 hypothetical protein G6F55_000106 [Rhizopus delemar]KAG1553627.1 hypothetical protein G6F51_000472 [Rhizopus arrhizus]KAG1504477.1 hypothetical protein G6F54_000968 [Rhizopus delemar]KAG1518101.1 hypothetical protein G6F53_000853 [Rhizopus delemar]|eukprot:EIE86651.1 hypothetical protein RO3G_11362 [Rhizopus delemar RA 99-880]
MKITDMLNPTIAEQQLLSPPPSPQTKQSMTGKSRSRFSNAEDAIICEGVARGLTWGQISHQLPHRKRATCFNRYRTLQGIRKSRKRSIDSESVKDHWLPSPPPQFKYRKESLPPLVVPLPLHYTYMNRMH